MICEAGFIKPGDVLLVDGEKALMTPYVQRYLEDFGIIPFVFPSAVHQLLNPCDNSFHSVMKMSYYRMVSNTNSIIDLKMKFRMALTAYESIGSDIVTSMFGKCGLIPTAEDKLTIAKTLLCEGLTTLDANDQKHKKALLKYLIWCRENDRYYLCPIPLDLI
jgi:hypothetical protein